MSGRLTIPYSQADKTRAYRRCIERAAYAADTEPHKAAFIVSRFLEGVADEVIESKDHCVLIPCFGMFGIRIHEPRKPGKLPYSTAAFYAARTFHRAVALEAPRDRKAHEKLQQYRRTHGHWFLYSTTQRNTMREQLRKQRAALVRRGKQLGSRFEPVTA